MSHGQENVGSLVIYGANGFVGTEASRVAARRGLHPVLAGRDAEAVGDLARSLGVEARAFALTDAEEVRAGLDGAALVLNMAGPFAGTYRPLVEACLDVGAHYVDITGELDVLIGMARYASAAEDRGVMLMPAAGLDSVPADCLAAELRGRLPTATRLRLGLQTTGPAGLPPGTKRTMIGLAHLPDRVIRNGQVVEAGGPTSVKIDFGRGPVTAVRYQAADTLVAHRTTGIADVEAYVALPALLRSGYVASRRLRWALAPPALRSLLGRVVGGGSTPEQRSRSRTNVWAEVQDDGGRRAAARLRGPEGAVEWTVASALAIVEKALGGSAVPGLQTPAGAYGPGLVLETSGVTWEDL